MNNAASVKVPLEPLSGHTPLYGDNRVDLRTTTDKISLRIREMAFHYISLYGLKRVTMQDVALACHISRAAMYQRFSNKESLFIAIREYVLHEALSACDIAWKSGVSVGKNFAATLLLRDMYLFDLVNDAPHGRDLLYSGNEINASVDQNLLKKSSHRLLERLAEYEDIHFGAFDGADKLCEFASRTSFALMLSGRKRDVVIADIEALCASVDLAVAA